MLTFPCAKINLGLNVVRKRADGYHDIETVFYAIPLADVLEIKPLSHNDVEDIQFLGMPAGEDYKNNLVYKVYHDMRQEFDLPPMSLYLYKKIPTGAGLGGGSSDAAETMKTINEIFELHLSDNEMERRISHYGADCAFFVRKLPVYATGVGDVFEKTSVSLKGFHLVLVKPAESVNTREAYSNLTPRLPEHDIRETLKGGVETWRELLKNDFEPSVFAAHPRIAAIKQTLYDMGALYASMSGSGSAVFALFDRPVPEATNVFDDCFTFEKELTR